MLWKAFHNKRFYAAEDLMMETLQCHLLEVDLQQAKVLLLSYNRPHQSMEVWEEAMVLKDLLETHELDQRRLAKLTGYSRSWVSRRLSLVDKINEEVCAEIKMGTLTSSHARALMKLPRDNQAQVARVITGTGQREQVTFFSYILCYSRRQYINVVDDKTQKTLFSELIGAFIYLDGVPREIKSDNQKACVDHWEMGQPVFNRKYLDFASHYLYRPLTITPGKPTENLKVERPFYYLERSFLNGREFKDREDLKAQLRGWLTEVNDVREHGTTRRRPIDRYLEEHPFLQVLPANHYDTSQVTHLVVNQESCVQWKGYQYVVPRKYLYEVCPVRITEEHLVVYSPDGEPLVTHPLAKQGQKERYVGVPQKTSRKIDLALSDVVTRLQYLAPEMSVYIEQVKRHKPTSWGHHLRRLLALKVNYRVDDILVAVRRAQQYKVYDAGTIERFLENNSEPRYPIKLSFKTQNNNDYEH